MTGPAAAADPGRGQRQHLPYPVLQLPAVRCRHHPGICLGRLAPDLETSEVLAQSSTDFADLRSTAPRVPVLDISRPPDRQAGRSFPRLGTGARQLSPLYLQTQHAPEWYQQYGDYVEPREGCLPPPLYLHITSPTTDENIHRGLRWNVRWSHQEMLCQDTTSVLLLLQYMVVGFGYSRPRFNDAYCMVFIFRASSTRGTVLKIPGWWSLIESPPPG